MTAYPRAQRRARKVAAKAQAGTVTACIDHEGVLCVRLPIRTASESNARDKWGKIKRTTEQRGLAGFTVTPLSSKVDGPYLVTITRVAPRKLDTGNLAASLKAVQDGTADALAINDGDEDAATWRYEQRKGGRGEYAVEIEIMRREDETTIALEGAAMTARWIRQHIVQCERALKAMG